MMKYLLAFESTHAAISTEKILKAHMPVSVIPTPRSITASCGISLLVEAELSEIRTLVEAAQTADEAVIYRFEEGKAQRLDS